MYRGRSMKRLRELRREHKLTQEQAAEVMAVTRRTYLRYEQGDSVPDIRQAALLADRYKVSLDYLVGRSDKR